MLGIPSRYEINKEFAIKTFITADLTAKEKKRFKEAVMEIRLMYQVTGEDIPSLINDEYDCQAILFFSVKLDQLKNANFVGNIMQRLVKPLCVIRFYDHTNSQVFCFCHKRLNLNDRTQVVIEDTVYSVRASMQFADEVNTLMEKHIEFDKIQNRGNKLDFYLEMMVKAYIISNLALWSGTRALLVSKVWYNRDNMLKLYDGLKRTEQLKKEQKSAKTIAENSRINAELKRLYAEFDKIVGNQGG
ncbi:MAG: DUF4391 domain-containing protein [Firmicutes bacterium]|nr:DUF4391 domain-containing protein [Bacillota bacterium]